MLMMWLCVVRCVFHLSPQPCGRDVWGNAANSFSCRGQPHLTWYLHIVCALCFEVSHSINTSSPWASAFLKHLTIFMLSHAWACLHVHCNLELRLVASSCGRCGFIVDRCELTVGAFQVPPLGIRMMGMHVVGVAGTNGAGTGSPCE